MKKYKHQAIIAIIIIISTSYIQAEDAISANSLMANSKLSAAPALRKPTVSKASFFRERRLKNGARIV